MPIRPFPTEFYIHNICFFLEDNEGGILVPLLTIPPTDHPGPQWRSALQQERDGKCRSPSGKKSFSAGAKWSPIQAHKEAPDISMEAQDDSVAEEDYHQGVSEVSLDPKGEGQRDKSQFYPISPVNMEGKVFFSDNTGS